MKLNQDMMCGEWFVRCKDDECLGTGPMKLDPTRAILAWNHRPGENGVTIIGTYVDSIGGGR